MELSKIKKLSNQIIDNECDRCCEIYKITNLSTNKSYIGQAVTHILNHGRYRPYGKDGRFRCHVSEAYSKKKNQCHYLNNAIKKYGPSDFDVEHIEYCRIIDANDKERKYISEYKTLFPDGYNLYEGGCVPIHTVETRKRVSSGMKKFYKNKKMEKFKNVCIDIDCIEKYIKPLRRNQNQYGWYVYIDGIKADFGGIHTNIDDSYNEATYFIKTLVAQQIATCLDAGNPLEPSTTTST